MTIHRASALEVDQTLVDGWPKDVAVAYQYESEDSASHAGVGSAFGDRLQSCWIDGEMYSRCILNRERQYGRYLKLYPAGAGMTALLPVLAAPVFDFLDRFPEVAPWRVEALAPFSVGDDLETVDQGESLLRHWGDLLSRRPNGTRFGGDNPTFGRTAERNIPILIWTFGAAAARFRAFGIRLPQRRAFDGA